MPVLLIGTLDTKGVEFQFVRDLLNQHGVPTLVMDAAVQGPPHLPPDIPRERVFAAAGTTLAAAAMRALPFGVPKLMVSTLASGQVKQWVGIRDILMMSSVVDISGLNRISRTVLTNAARAMLGMVQA